jgi:hypothetical protein
VNFTPCFHCHHVGSHGWMRLKCDGTRAETRFRLSAKRTSPFKSAGTSVQSTAGSRSVRISGSNAGYTMFRGSVKISGYPLHSSVSPSLPLPCVTVCHHVSTGLYHWTECWVSHSRPNVNLDTMLIELLSLPSFKVNYKAIVLNWVPSNNILPMSRISGRFLVCFDCKFI